VAHRYHGRRKTLQYLVKWKGYPASDNTWEPIDQIHAPDLLKIYHRRNPLTSIKATLVQRSNQLDYPPHHPSLLSSICTSPNLYDSAAATPVHVAPTGPTTPLNTLSTSRHIAHTSTSAPCASNGSPTVSRSDVISTTPTSSDTHPLAASAPRPCQTTLPALTYAISAPKPPSAKLPSPFISQPTYLPINDPSPAQHVDEDSLTNTTYVSMNALTTSDESKSTSANTAIFDQTGYKISPAIPSSCITARASMHRSPTTYQSQSPGDLLSRFLKHVHPSHALQTRSFNLAVG
jgi:hypothetical protein